MVATPQSSDLVSIVDRLDDAINGDDFFDTL
jgi:hypothetical protein